MAVVACWCVVTVDLAFAANFFKAAKAPPASLSADGIYPMGRKIGFGLYAIAGYSKINPSITNMQRVADAGFTLAGPYYDTNWRDFRTIHLAAQEGLQFTYAIRRPESVVGRTVDERAAILGKMTDAQMAAGVREQVSAVLQDPIARNTVARWSLGTEELRHWEPSEIRYLKVASATVRAVEKEFNVTHRPFWMYEPNHRTTSDLKKTGAHQDIISKGNYLADLPRGLNRAGQAIWNYTQTVSAANSMKKMPQAVLQLDRDFADPLTGKNPDEIRRVIRHDAYLGLTMGIKDFNVFSMHENRPNLTTHNDQFLAYASVANDLTGPLNLQEAFLFGEKRSDIKLAVTQGTKTFNFTDMYGKKHKFDTLRSYNAAVGTSRYLFLVNSTEQPMDVNISKLPSKFLLDDLFAGTTREMLKKDFTHRLDVLGVSAFRIREWSAVPAVLAAMGGGAMGIPVPEPSTIIPALSALALFSGLRRRT